ncbi:LacI family DNA-binding transcriptional regulator [Paralimibaculum aggregatum]|uniref:LacI family DNA-binding transcriptional regulator n=1 Tax=Paralimibaculum aggregatum TaxID=3036245 RepID=A0ABQ6LQH0_9RHOB|nr:LacI family DNA-binding transcriptional regulator [Limibaculum sp. NKW23]GMG83144.1 LacI family DNA-binding transcriptional regulator [Limibaculum sp. NKW23]
MTVRRGKKRANLRDVARAAEVSVATVSRVLNTPDVVQAETRRRVEAAMAELHFVRSAAARAINTGRSKILGALIPTLDNAIFASTIDAIESRLGDFGLSLVVATTGEDPEVEARKAQGLLDIGVEGLFLSGITHHDTLHALIEHTAVPAVVISYYDANYHLPTIGYDNREAGRIALAHLVGLGHRRIAVVHNPAEHNDRTRERLAGFESAPADVVLTRFESALTVAGGARAAAMALASGAPFDAFLCASDVQALGVLFELQRAGIAVPEAVSVMGLHDLPSAAVTAPRLSTVHLPAEEMGRRAAEAMADWVENEVPARPICLPTALKIRESTRRRGG